MYIIFVCSSSEINWLIDWLLDWLPDLVWFDDWAVGQLGNVIMSIALYFMPIITVTNQPYRNSLQETVRRMSIAVYRVDIQADLSLVAYVKLK